jgi:hypothetical protein
MVTSQTARGTSQSTPEFLNIPKEVRSQNVLELPTTLKELPRTPGELV